MHIAIDVRQACSDKRTGKGQWTFGFVSELLTRDVHLTLLADQPVPDSWLSSTGKIHVERFTAGWRWHVHATGRLKTIQPDVYVSPESMIVPLLLGDTVRYIPIIHDLIAFRRERHDRKAMLLERLLLPRILKKAAHVCTISEATKRDVREKFPHYPAASITSIFAGVADAPFQTRQPDPATILCVGTLSPRKNQKRLIEAFTLLPSPLRETAKLQLVGGRGWADREIISFASATPGVEWLNFVPSEKLDQLTAHATIFALPSLYEGFGLPILEAMQRGIPVLTSDRGSLKEVAGDAALFADPEDVASIADGLEQLLTDVSLRETLIAKGREQAKRFSWTRTVDLFIEVARRI